MRDIYGDIELSVISVLLLCEAKRGSYMCDRGDMLREKIRGPRTEPCGTPELQMEVGDLEWPIRTN